MNGLNSYQCKLLTHIQHDNIYCCVNLDMLYDSAASNFLSSVMSVEGCATQQTLKD